METTEFQVDLCVLVVATYEKKLGLDFGKELPIVHQGINFQKFWVKYPGKISNWKITYE